MDALLPILFAVTIAWTNPATLADTVLCGVGPVPMSDLAQAVLVGQRPYSTVAETLAFHDVTGKEGLPDSLEWSDLGEQWITWLAFRRRFGPWSCESNRMAVNLPTGVYGNPTFPPPLRLYDVAGRRVVGPPKPGIYFRRLAGRVYRLVIVR